MITIKEWMSKPVITVKQDDLAFAAISKMVKHNIGDVIVVDKNRAPVGIVTERDMMRRIMINGKDPKKIKISQIMTKKIKSAQDTSSILEVSRMMKKGGFRRVPITCGKKVVGIVTARDLVKFISC